MSDINLFKNFVFVQYSLTEDNKMSIPRNGIYSLKTVALKYLPDSTFIGLERGTIYGHKKLKGCTHWALVDLSDNDNPVIIHKDQFTDNSDIQIIRIRDHYMVMKPKGFHYFSFAISKYATYKEMRENTQ